MVGALFLADVNRGRPVIAEIPGLHQQFADAIGLRCGDLVCVVQPPLFESEPGAAAGLREQINGAKNGNDAAVQAIGGDQWRSYDLLACGVQNDVHLFGSFVVNGPINRFPKKFT